MKDFNRDKFNSTFQEKFSQAKFPASNAVWDGIEADLLRQENGEMKKRAAFYRNVAAAVIFIALISIYFNLQNIDFNKVASNQFQIELLEGNFSEFLSKNENTGSIPQAHPKEGDPFENDIDKFAKAIMNQDQMKQDQGQLLSGSLVPYVESSDRLLTESIALQGKVAAIEPEKLYLPLASAEVKNVSYFAVSEFENSNESSSIQWNSNVNVGSGSFNPNSEISSAPISSSVSSLNSPGVTGRSIDPTADVVESQERETIQGLSSAPMQSNISFSLGINAGVELNSKWNIRSGLQYGNYRSSTNSSTVMRDRNSDLIYPYHGASSATEISDGRVINVTSDYELYNDFQILSVPVIASYKIVDRKLDISIVAGATADFLIKNTLRAGSEKINQVSFDANDKQAYRSFFASGITGIEFSYPIAKNYSLNLMPTYKRAISNVTTEEASFRSLPAFTGLNMSLSYQF